MIHYGTTKELYQRALFEEKIHAQNIYELLNTAYEAIVVAGWLVNGECSLVDNSFRFLISFGIQYRSNSPHTFINLPGKHNWKQVRWKKLVVLDCYRSYNDLRDLTQNKLITLSATIVQQIVWEISKTHYFAKALSFKCSKFNKLRLNLDMVITFSGECASSMIILYRSFTDYQQKA